MADAEGIYTEQTVPRTPGGRVRPRHQAVCCAGGSPRARYCWCDIRAKRKDQQAKRPTNAQRGRITPKQRYRPLLGVKQDADPDAEYAALGAPPRDPLAATSWAHEVMITGMHHIARDATMTEKERRKELREQARVMKDLVPQRDLYAAAALVRGEMASLLEGDGPELVDAPRLNSSTGPRKTKRGRPRKR